MKIFVRTLMTVGLAAMLFGGVTACKSSGNKCGKAFDNMVTMGKAQAEKLAKGMGQNKAAMEKQIDAKIAKAKPQFMKKCKAELKKNPKKVEKGLDCMIAAKTMADFQKCGASLGAM